MNEQPQNNHPLEDQPEEVVLSTPGEQPSEASPGRKLKFYWQFVAGFLGWYLITALLYWLADDPFVVGIFLFPVNLLILIVLLRMQPQIGWGMLFAIAVNLVISLILGLGFNSVCFVPFFIPLY